MLEIWNSCVKQLEEGRKLSQASEDLFEYVWKELTELRNDTSNFRMWSKIDEAKTWFNVRYNTMQHKITSVRGKSFKIHEILEKWVARKDHAYPIVFVEEGDEQD